MSISSHNFEKSHDLFGAFHTLIHSFSMVKREPSFFRDFSFFRDLNLRSELLNFTFFETWEDWIALVYTTTFVNLSHQSKRNLSLVACNYLSCWNYCSFVSTCVYLIYVDLIQTEPFTNLFTFFNSFSWDVRLMDSVSIVKFLTNLTEYIIGGLPMSHNDQSHFKLNCR